MTGLVLAWAAIALVPVFVIVWMGLIKRVEIDEGRWIVNTMIAASTLLGVAAFTQSPGTLARVLAGIAVTIGVVYAVLYTLRGQSDQVPAVAVGQPLPDFTAPDENGERFALSSLRGKPVLIKFFRGHW